MNKLITNKSYNKGFNDGIRHGMSRAQVSVENELAERIGRARKSIVIELIDRMGGLQEVKGIGPKTWHKIQVQLGIDEFEEKKSKGGLKE